MQWGKASLAAMALALGAWAQQPATAPASPQAPQVLSPPATATTSASSGKKKKDTPVAVRVTVQVVDPKGVPVQGAGVVLRQDIDHLGYTPKNPFQVELHTDEKGQVLVQGFEPGQISVQVIAKGFQTWGKLLPLKNADEKFHVQLSEPKPQISIYGHGG